MESIESLPIVLAAFAAIAGIAVLMIGRAKSRRAPDDPRVRFESGLDGIVGLYLVLFGCFALAMNLIELVHSSHWAVGSAILVNCVTQPVLALVCWIAVRNL